MNERVLYLIPSMEKERRNEIFNIELLFITGIIGLFLNIFIIFGCLILNSIAPIYEGFLFPIIATGYAWAGILVLSIPFGVKIMTSFLKAYQIDEDGNLICASINVQMIGSNMVNDALKIGLGLKGLGTGNISYTNLGNTLDVWFKIIKAAKINTNPEFVKQLFDTDVYKKRKVIAKRVQYLGSESKYLFFRDGISGEQIKVSRLYEFGDSIQEKGKKPSILHRVLMQLLLLMLITVIFDLGVFTFAYGSGNRVAREDYISLSTPIQDVLDEYDYISKLSQDHYMVKASKQVNDVTSRLTINLKKDGSVKEVDAELYFENNKNAEEIVQEVSGLFRAINIALNEEEMKEAVENFQNDKLGFYSQSIEGHRYRIGTSRGYITFSGYKN